MPYFQGVRRKYSSYRKKYGYKSKANPYKQGSYNRSGVRYYAPKKDTLAVSRQMQVMRNPFSTATNAPKIPDGKCSLSTGQRFQSINSLAIEKAGDGIINIVLFGGLGGGCFVYQPSSLTEKEKFLPLPGNHGQWNVSEYDSGTLDRVGLTQNGPDAITQWRIVSEGLKVTLTNNADENDGFFESVRLSATRANEHWRWARNAVNGTSKKLEGINALGQSCFLVPTTDGTSHSMFGVDFSTLVDHPTYQTGKLRDVHKFIFNNKPESNSHDFKRLRLTHEYELDTYGVTPTERQQALVFGQGLPYNSEAARVVEENIDDTLDIVVIRIHGRTGTVEGGDTKLLAHFVQNQEVCYENGTTLSRFHTIAYKGYNKY